MADPVRAEPASSPESGLSQAPEPQLSTALPALGPEAVDDSRGHIGCRMRRLGLVIPKRHAKRAVTRNLFKRQARAAWERTGTTLACGDWVLRLRAPFDPKQFPSARSAALREVVREELQGLFKAAGRARPAEAA